MFWSNSGMVARMARASSPGLPIAAGKGSLTTCQTRIRDFDDRNRSAGDALLSAYAELYVRVEGSLFAQVATGWSAPSLKRKCLLQYRMPARMFNGVRVSLERKLSSLRPNGTPQGGPAAATRAGQGSDRGGVYRNGVGAAAPEALQAEQPEGQAREAGLSDKEGGP